MFDIRDRIDHIIRQFSEQKAHSIGNFNFGGILAKVNNKF